MGAQLAKEKENSTKSTKTTHLSKKPNQESATSPIFPVGSVSSSDISAAGSDFSNSVSSFLHGPALKGQQQAMNLEALFDFQGSELDDSQMPMRQGERFTVLNRTPTGEWTHVQSVISGQSGWVPSAYLREVPLLTTSTAASGHSKQLSGSHNAPTTTVGPDEETLLDDFDWYHGAVQRSQAEYILDSCSNASFLVRESESHPGKASISLRCEQKILHYKILHDPINGTYYINAMSHFHSLKDLIVHHSKNLDGLPCCLRFSAPKRAKPTVFSLQSNDDQWEIDRGNIKIKSRLGSGQFGIVYEAQYEPYGLTVAVKTVKDDITINVADFLKEGQMMKRLKHPNLVQLIGVCSRHPPYYIITEFVTNGNLLDYLHSHPREELRPPVLLYMGRQVASGMAYLEQHNFIHRDLAARNCLVGDDHVVKVADFGLARFIPQEDMYTAHTGTRVPIKWTAPEGLAYGQFTIRSDVWAFGVVLWELATYGSNPYPGVELYEVFNLLESGYRMERPDGCPENVHRLMLKCWQWEPNRRPSFQCIVEELITMFENSSIDKEVARELARRAEVPLPSIPPDSVPAIITENSSSVSSNASKLHRSSPKLEDSSHADGVRSLTRTFVPVPPKRNVPTRKMSEIEQTKLADNAAISRSQSASLRASRPIGLPLLPNPFASEEKKGFQDELKLKLSSEAKSPISPLGPSSRKNAFPLKGGNSTDPVVPDLAFAMEGKKDAPVTPTRIKMTPPASTKDGVSPSSSTNIASTTFLSKEVLVSRKPPPTPPTIATASSMAEVQDNKNEPSSRSSPTIPQRRTFPTMKDSTADILRVKSNARENSLPDISNAEELPSLIKPPQPKPRAQVKEPKREFVNSGNPSGASLTTTRERIIHSIHSLLTTLDSADPTTTEDSLQACVTLCLNSLDSDGFVDAPRLKFQFRDNCQKLSSAVYQANRLSYIGSGNQEQVKKILLDLLKLAEKY